MTRRTGRHAATRGGLWRRAPAVLTPVFGAVLAVVAACGGGGSTAEPARTPTPGSAIPGAGAQPASSPSATPTPALPTVAPSATPPRRAALPTPVLPGFPTIALPDSSPGREIIDAVNRGGPAYARAIAERDERFLAGAYTGEALTQYSAEVAKERAQSTRTQTALLSIALVSLEQTTTTANVSTRERWRHQAGNTCTIYNYDEFYQLVPADGLWLIAKNQFVQTSTSAC